MLIQKSLKTRCVKYIFLETDDVKKIKNQMINKNLSIQNIADKLMLSKSYTHNMLNGIRHIMNFIKELQDILDMNFRKEFDLKVELI